MLIFFRFLKNMVTFAALIKKRTCRSGGMVDAMDSKSIIGNDVRVRVPPPVQQYF
jgi:hypothetical protein